VYGWIKVFEDGSTEEVYDKDILSGKGSWSKGKLDNIAGVCLVSKGLCRLLFAPNTSWHQFDKFSITLSAGKHKPIRTHQVVQAKIQRYHVGMYVEFNTQTRSTATSVAVVSEPQKHLFSLKIKERHINKWLSLSTDKDLTTKINFVEKRGQLPR